MTDGRNPPVHLSQAVLFARLAASWGMTPDDLSRELREDWVRVRDGGCRPEASDPKEPDNRSSRENEASPRPRPVE